jgi:hypothetical protein
VDLRYGSTADQGRTGREDSSSRLWRRARAPGTHAKQGPSTGHSAAGLRQGGEMSPDAEATFHRASCTLGNQVVGASDGPPFRQERRPIVYAELPGPVAVCLPKQALCWQPVCDPTLGYGTSGRSTVLSAIVPSTILARMVSKAAGMTKAFRREPTHFNAPSVILVQWISSQTDVESHHPTVHRQSDNVMSATAMRDYALTIDGVPVFRSSAEPRPTRRPRRPHHRGVPGSGRARCLWHEFGDSALLLPELRTH